MGLPLETVDIRESCELQMKNLGHSGKPDDVAFENIQARYRTAVLMNRANMIGGLVIGTGDLSELALGWCTYNGDHMSMYGVNSGVPKTLVKYLVRWGAETWVPAQVKSVLLDILDTPISPELLPPGKDGKIEQKTEDRIGPYELHDFFLFHAVRYGFGPSKVLSLAETAFGKTYDRPTILRWLKVFYSRFFSQQFKRSCLPDGPKVGTIALSPRGDWRMPSDADAAAWLSELEGN
jgi:NAD+ synthase (glutamine-hydrolysing)